MALMTPSQPVEGQTWNPPRDRKWTSEDAQKMAKAFAESKGTLKAFAVRHGVGAERLRWWLKRQGHAAPKKKGGGAVLFAPVRVVATAGNRPVSSEPGNIEVVLRDGRGVRVGIGFDIAHLRRVVAAIEGGIEC